MKNIIIFILIGFVLILGIRTNKSYTLVQELTEKSKVSMYKCTINEYVILNDAPYAVIRNELTNGKVYYERINISQGIIDYVEVMQTKYSAEVPSDTITIN